MKHFNLVGLAIAALTVVKSLAEPVRVYRCASIVTLETLDVMRDDSGVFIVAAPGGAPVPLAATPAGDFVADDIAFHPRRGLTHAALELGGEKFQCHVVAR